MSKLIDADKLRESLAFNLMVYQKLADKQTPVNAEFVVNDLKRFVRIIDEAPDLSPKIDGLDEAAERYTDNPGTYATWTEHYGDFAFVDDIALVEKAFKAGAKWQAEQTPKLPNNLVEAAEKFALSISKDLINTDLADYIFKAGAKWMAEQDVTVETIMQYDEFDNLIPTGKDMAEYGFKPGDKAIVQIRKK